MKRSKTKNNKGFSLVELIVIMAIMTVAVGTLTLSISLVTGSEAKKAYRKLDAMLNEVKTGSMSRFDEDITVVYKTRDVLKTESGATGDYDADGYYAVKEIKTITPSGTGSGYNGSLRYVDVAEMSLGKENRLVCDNRVTITLYYMDTADTEQSITLAPDGASSFTIKFDRATGLYKGVIIDGGTLQGVPTKLELTSGINRTYTMTFDEVTGRHS